MAADATDWISAVSSVVGAIIGIVTLVTVYIGALQLLSQNRMYRLGLSWRSIGPWQVTVAKWALFGLQRRISSPIVSLKALLGEGWKPNISFPIGLPRTKDECVEKGTVRVQAQASWVNFMQAIDLSPDDSKFYEMQDAPELVNGIVPMLWKGKDLAGMCSILGFQSFETSPSFKQPMPIPMQWSSPLGWLQFRTSDQGCIAEFRRRMMLDNQISKDLHDHQFVKNSDLKHEPHFLHSRLWISINGLSLDTDGEPPYQTLYLGGTDGHKRPQEAEEEQNQTEQELLDDLTSNDLSPEEILQCLFGKKEGRPEALRREAERKERAVAQRSQGRDGDMPEFLNAMLKDRLETRRNKKEVLRPCPGLLSVTVEGELAYNRGLDIRTCHEYDRKYTEPEDVDHEKYPHNLGNLYMDNELLALMKNALLLLQPDGFYLSCTQNIYQDIFEVYEHISKRSNVLKEIFPPKKSIAALEQYCRAKNFSTDSSEADKGYGYQGLKFAMELCNDLQRTRKTARACFTVEDMQLLTKVSSMMRKFLDQAEPNNGRDLQWALLYCPRLVPNILQALRRVDYVTLLEAKFVCTNGILDCTALFLDQSEESGEKENEPYKVALVADGEYSGAQMMAALCATLITYYWIETKWITDVSMYDTTMPQSVLMC